MGWLFSERWETKRQMVDHLLDPKTWSERYKGVLDKAVVGNHLWAVIELQDEKFIFLALLGKKSNYGWGYKDMTESMGPYEHDCPLRFFKLVPEPAGEYGAAWRERVRAYHQQQAERTKPVVGQTYELRNVRVGPKTVTIQSLRPLMGTDQNGCRWRITRRVMATATLVEAVTV